MRIGKEGIIGLIKKDDERLEDLVLRVGSLCYEPDDQCKKFELKYRC
jgi:hypothetical protein